MSNRTSPARTPVTIYLSSEELAEVDALAATGDSSRESAAHDIFRIGFLAGQEDDSVAEDDEEDE